MSRRHAIGLVAGLAVAAGVSSRHEAHASPAQVSVPVADGLSIMPRAAWAGGREPTGALSPEPDVRFLLVHHTASANGDDPVTVMRVAYDFHTGPDKGWPDVAYNFFIDQFGVVWEARAGSLDGPVEASATGGSQGFAQLVCLLGDFTSQLPTPEALDALNRTLAWLAVRSKISTSPGSTTQFVSRGSNRWPQGDMVTAATISGHRDMSQTACPGDTFYPYLVANIPGQVTDLIALSTVSSTMSTTSAPPTTTGPTNGASPTEPAATPLPTAPIVSPATTADRAEATTPASTTASSTPPTVPAGDSGRDLANPALAVLGGAALAGAALLARRNHRAGGSGSTAERPLETNHE